MVERSLSMREVPGSIPGTSTRFQQFICKVSACSLDAVNSVINAVTFVTMVSLVNIYFTVIECSDISNRGR